VSILQKSANLNFSKLEGKSSFLAFVKQFYEVILIDFNG